MKLAPIVLLSFVVFVAGCTSTDTPITTTTTGESTSTTLSSTSTTTQNNVKEVTMTAKKWEFTPSMIEVNKGDTLKLTVTSIDVTHGLSLPAFGINENLVSGENVVIEFVADKTGTFPFTCSVFCGSGHGTMTGEIIVI
jgi:cytochrome c oxidase subunit II